MSVATQLGLDDPDHGLLRQAREHWRGWGQMAPSLRVVDDLLDMPAWSKRAQVHEPDEVLLVLARLASPRGGDDRVAAAALAWLLVPGACLLAHRLRGVTPRIDEVVAAQLWLEVRGFPWERQRKVAANILWNTHRGVLRDLEVGDYLRQVDPTWARVHYLDPASDGWPTTDPALSGDGVPAGVELAHAIEWALDQGAITHGDWDLLARLAVTAQDAGVTRSGCGRGGLCSLEVAEAVAAQHGVSASTVRRRATTSLRAVAAAYAQIPA